MNIAKFAKKPELVKVTLDSEDILSVYNDPVTFYILDSIDIATYFEFYKSQSDNDGERLNSIMRKLMLDENGKQVIEEGSLLPVDLALASLTAIGEVLGKSKTK